MRTPDPKQVVCECLKVTEARVVAAIRTKGACTLADLAVCTQAGSGCTACHVQLESLIEREARRCPRVESLR